MSTNYYLNDPKGATIHIGKSSLGWQFLFNVGNPDSMDPIDSFDAWMNHLDIAERMGHQIEDEYGRPVTRAELRELIIQKQLDGKNGWNATDEMIGPWAAQRRREKMDPMERFDRKGFRFSTSRDFS